LKIPTPIANTNPQTLLGKESDLFKLWLELILVWMWD